MEPEIIKKRVKCCITGRPLNDSESVNIIELPYHAEWKHPIMNNILIPDYGNRAIAIIHDDCIDRKGKIKGEIKFAVEFAGDDAIYHPVNKLKKIDTAKHNQKQPEQPAEN